MEFTKVMEYIKKNMKTLLLVAIIVITIIVAQSSNPFFLSPTSLRELLFNMSAAGIMMIGISCLLMSGSIDLSSDAQALLGMIAFAKLLRGTGFVPALPWTVALLVTLAIMFAIAMLHSFLCTRLRFMPFIATIATSSVYSGIASVWSNAEEIRINSSQPILNLAGNITVKIGSQDFLLPYAFLLMLTLIIVYGVILSKTRFGRSIYLCGGNQRAARLSGLNPEKISTILFVNNSVLVLIGGLVWASYKKMASLNFATAAVSMSGMTAAILGGVSFMGGGSTGMGGAFIGLVLVNVFTQGLTYIFQDKSQQFTWLSLLCGGLILVVALIIDSISSSRQAKALIAARRKAIQKSVSAS
jgi:ribose/xylose/arabinose/galactoside ABC-type transport system permease subunit